MKKTLRTFCLAATALAGITLTSCSDDDNGNNGSGGSKPDLEFYGLIAGNTLVKLNANDSDDAISTTTITGLESGDNIIAIDFRPQTGQLIGLGSTNRLYVINHLTGAAKALGTAPFTPAVAGDMVGFDFNPTVDRIRLVTSTGQNLRLNPETGTVAATDGNLNPGTPQVGAAAYTNSTAGATTTALFAINFADGMLYKQDPPNDGTLTAIGSLDINNFSTMSDGGFDIAQDNTTALASFTIGSESKLYKIDLTTGKARNLGELDMPLIGLAIPVAPVAYAVASNTLHIFNPMDIGTPTTKTIQGLDAGVNIVGIDMRPATGQLFALGSNSRIYTINVSNGTATAIGAAAFGTLDGTDFGFDFNPLVDRIRIVSNTGQNLRVNPNDGVLAATDGSLNPGTPNVTSAAYTNNFAGTTSTELFVIDSTMDMLFKQNPPNDGTLVTVGMLGADVTAQSGFDIGGTSNTGYAILTVGSASKIYSVNTGSGAVTAMGNFPAAVSGFAVGLGF
ncbi:MAG: DUF4394 domain-containing protein [Flavobacterium sp.]|uniref:DUF4394 domain-containing protein n=1 Tax=Flavobacterium sp. TaxID=239 RepID=UPI00121F1004|nr:DUF4394 domain-containing protein [Flavobacterium sp.]RZJ66242.1 MAG: DUF4394 domain-containing protein [Flavobacterium sp.]